MPNDSKHSQQFHIGMRSGANASAIYVYDGSNEHDDSCICQVYGIPLHTDIDELRSSPQFKEGLERAEMIIRAVNTHADLLVMLERALTDELGDNWRDEVRTMLNSSKAKEQP